MTRNAEGAAGDLTTDLAALRQDVAHLAATMSALVQHQTEAVGVRAAAAMGDAKDTIASKAGEVQNRVRVAGRDLEASYDRHPFTVLLIAFGVGITLGMMSRWRV
ncbi:MAG: hypothetical protein WAS21_32385 [Geminicoccaceae bacterium]